MNTKKLRTLELTVNAIANYREALVPKTSFKTIENLTNERIKNVINSFENEAEKSPAILKHGLSDCLSFSHPFIKKLHLIESFVNEWSLSQDIKIDLFKSSDKKSDPFFQFYEYR